MNDSVTRLNAAERDLSHPIVRPRNAATLILIDRSTTPAKVLLGRRHDGHKFMPGKFVFPGGRVEPHDRLMTAASALERHVEGRLASHVVRLTRDLPRALALA